MSDALTIGWSEDQAKTRKDTYQKVLGFNMALHLGIGLLCMFAPYFVSDIFGLPPPVPSGWNSRLGRNAYSRHRALYSRPARPFALAISQHRRRARAPLDGGHLVRDRRRLRLVRPVRPSFRGSPRVALLPLLCRRADDPAVSLRSPVGSSSRLRRTARADAQRCPPPPPCPPTNPPPPNRENLRRPNLRPAMKTCRRPKAGEAGAPMSGLHAPPKP